MKVLVVNDERATANSIAEILDQNGHNALPLCKAVEAVEHAEKLTFDVALIGLMMTGVDLADRLRELMPRCTIVLVFGEPTLGIAKRLRSDFNYLSESFKTDDLLKKLREIAAQCGLAHEEMVFSDSPKQL